MPSIAKFPSTVNKYPSLHQMADACWQERTELATAAEWRGEWQPGDLERCRDLEKQAAALERAAKCDLEQIETLQRLAELARGKRAVFCPNMGNWYRPRPAAFILNISGTTILQLFTAGLFVYPKETTK